MKKLFVVLSVLMVLSMALTACGPKKTPTTEPPVGATNPPVATEPLKIGLVTDVGQLEDKSFNQAAYEGSKAAAEALGATYEVIVTQNISDYKQNIQTFLDQDFDVIVTVGFLIGSDTTIAAKENPDVYFMGVDQSICIDEAGAPDPTFGCKGDPAALLPNYQGILFAEEQPGYLAGIVAGSITKTGTIGSVAGTNLPAVVAYIKGYEAGAKSVNPNITTLSQEIDPDPVKGFNDPATGKAVAQQFIAQGADVLFQVAGLTGQGVLEAACDAGIYGIGVDVDQVLSLPNLAQCIVTSAEKKLVATIKAAIESVPAGTFRAGNVVYNAASVPPAIGLAPFHEFESLITPEIQSLLDAAFADMVSGKLVLPRK